VVVAEVVVGDGRTIGFEDRGWARVGWGAELCIGNTSPGEEKQAPMSSIRRKWRFEVGKGKWIKAYGHVMRRR